MDKNNTTAPSKNKFELYFRRKLTNLKKKSIKLWKHAKPYLAYKYWPIYAISFGFGFWLWGPFHGWQTLHNWSFQTSHPKVKTLSTDALQRQLSKLQQELKTAKAEKNIPNFDPATLSRPALGEVSRGFDWVQTGNSWRLHNGVDIKLPADSNVIAAAGGTITEVIEFAPGNFTVTIEHGNGWKSTYSNLAKALVNEGQQVIKGVIVGISGNSGCDPEIPSIHFAILHDQKAIDPKKVIPGI